jgi:hypothetical protein
LGKNKEGANFDCLNEGKIPKIRNILHKGKDKCLLPKTTYKSGSTSVATPIQQNSEASTSVKSGFTAPFVLQSDDSPIEIDTRLSSTNIRNQLYNSSIYSNDVPRQNEGSGINYDHNNFPLYQESINSDFATPETMTPLFGGSSRENSLRASIKSNEGNVSMYNPLDSSALISPNNYPTPLSVVYDRDGNHVNIKFNRNPRLTTSSFDSSSTYSKNNLRVNNKPYGLSGKGVLPNTTFNEMYYARNGISLQSTSYNQRLPIMPQNYESNLDNMANSPSVDDPCSPNYRSRHRPKYINETNRSSSEYYKRRFFKKFDFNPTSKEVAIKKPGLMGKVKLGFKTLANKFDNGINKIESVYIKYETVGKRHII